MPRFLSFCGCRHLLPLVVSVVLCCDLGYGAPSRNGLNMTYQKVLDGTGLTAARLPDSTLMASDHGIDVVIREEKGVAASVMIMFEPAVTAKENKHFEKAMKVAFNAVPEWRDMKKFYDANAEFVRARGVASIIVKLETRIISLSYVREHDRYLIVIEPANDE